MLGLLGKGRCCQNPGPGALAGAVGVTVVLGKGHQAGAVSSSSIARPTAISQPGREAARELKTPVTLFRLLTLQPPLSMALEANGRQREREAIS